MKQIVDNISIVPVSSIVSTDIKDTIEAKGTIERAQEVLALPPPKDHSKQQVNTKRKYCPRCGGLCREKVVHELSYNDLLLLRVTCSECKYKEEMYEDQSD